MDPNKTNGLSWTRPVPPQERTIFKPECVREVAETMGINNLPDEIAEKLASDVEYRIHQVVQEAARFTRHAHRTTLTTHDIDAAFRALNIEPLYGHFSHMPTTFRRVVPQGAPPVYFVEDEEVDFDKVIKEEKVVLPKVVSWHAHWLAVEGVQPMVPENPPRPPVVDKKKIKPKNENEPVKILPQSPPPRSILAPAGAGAATGAGRKGKTPKHVLSRELQVYYSRLTTALLPPTNEQAKRAAALSSLQYDAGLQNLLPYLVRWVGERVITAIRNSNTDPECGTSLEILLRVIHALIQNERLFMEPYLHQILPPLLSILLTSSLPTNPPTLRGSAAEILRALLQQHGATYPSLSERLTKTLLLSLFEPGKDRGTREGAVRGLNSLGDQGIKKGLIESRGAKMLGEEYGDGDEGIIGAVLEQLEVLERRSENPVPLDDMESDVRDQLVEVFGETFAAKIARDGSWARRLLAKAQVAG